MPGRWLMRLFVGAGAAASVAALVYVYAWPPASMRVDRDGVPHLSPPVAHPFTGEPLTLQELARHYKEGSP
ncbi:MAG: hypothetical protein N2544_15035 [Burkholderiales bacterium]|nr:hypothetical protein [Burkholderiales bacterium]